MAFKIKDGVRIGTVDVFNNAGTLLVPAPSWITARTVTFQDKASAPTASTDVTGSFTIDGTADVGEVVLTLDTILSGTLKVNEPNVTYGSSSVIPIFTVDAKGRITAISEAPASLQFTIQGDGPTTDTFQGGTVNFIGGTGIITTVADNGSNTGTNVTIAINSAEDAVFAGITAGNVTVGLTENNTITTSSGNLVLDSAGGTVTVNDNVIVTGDLTVNGTVTTVNSTTLTVNDKNIVLNETSDDAVPSSPTDASANEGGITLRGTTDKTILWIDSTDRWTFNQAIESSVGLQNTIVGNANPAAGTFTNLTVNGNTILGDAVTDDITLTGRFVAGTVLRSAQTATNTLALAAYDTDGAAYVNLITLTANPVPTLVLVGSNDNGTPGSINRMTIGASNPSTGAFTTLSATGTATFTGAITANTGANNQSFTTTSTNTITISSGGTGSIVNMSIGSSSPQSGAFTTLSASSTASFTGTLNPSSVITANTTTNNQTFSTTTGVISITSGAIGSINNMTIGATTAVTGRFTTVVLTDATNADSTTTGALQIDGGISVDKDIFITGNKVLANASGVAVGYERAIQTTVATVAPGTVIDTWAFADYRYATYVIQITQGASDVQISEVKVAHNGTTTYMTEYAVLETTAGGLASAFTSAINGLNVELRVTMNTATSATIKILRTLLVV